MQNIYLNACGIICALGDTPRAGQDAPVRGADRCGRDRCVVAGPRAATWACEAELPSMAHLPLPQRSRNNALALAALAQIRPAVDAAIARYGADRVGVVIGTSTSGIGETERRRPSCCGRRCAAGFHYGQQEMGSPAACCRMELGHWWPGLRPFERLLVERQGDGQRRAPDQYGTCATRW
jgi:3-oxoacyl-[acyl-carrier-protein] synthase-1